MEVPFIENTGMSYSSMHGMSPLFFSAVLHLLTHFASVITLPTPGRQSVNPGLERWIFIFHIIRYVNGPTVGPLRPVKFSCDAIQLLINYMPLR